MWAGSLFTSFTFCNITGSCSLRVVSLFLMNWQYLTGLRYTEIKQINKTKQGKQRGIKWKRETKYPRTGGTGENTPFAKQSRKKERDNGHDKVSRSNYYVSLNQTWANRATSIEIVATSKPFLNIFAGWWGSIEQRGLWSFEQVSHWRLCRRRSQGMFGFARHFAGHRLPSVRPATCRLQQKRPRFQRECSH